MANTKKKREIWIETRERQNGTVTFSVGTDWGCVTGFGRNTRKKVFNAIKNAMTELYPDAVVNPWIDDKPGTADFD